MVPLTSCLSSAGIAVQERKGLMKMERQAVHRQGAGHTDFRGDGRAFLGGSCNDDDDSGSTQTPLTASGSEEGSGVAEDPAWAKGAREKTEGCCSVNITTSFLPHTVRSSTQLLCYLHRTHHVAKRATRRTRQASTPPRVVSVDAITCLTLPRF